MTGVQDLRKIYSNQGVKGFGSANRAKFTADFEAAWDAAIVEDAARKPVAPVATAAPKKGICEDCGRKVGKSGHPTLCEVCFDYAGWENTHSDANHDGEGNGESESDDECPVCRPELDRRTPKGTGRSRAGMVIVAKGSEFHKSEIFRVAAVAAGWTVNVLGSVVDGEDGEEIERFVAVAKRGGDEIELAWNGRAYDYHASGATFNGKGRKVRNLKEALRLL